MCHKRKTLSFDKLCHSMFIGFKCQSRQITLRCYCLSQIIIHDGLLALPSLPTQYGKIMTIQQLYDTTSKNSTAESTSMVLDIVKLGDTAIKTVGCSDNTSDAALVIPFHDVFFYEMIAPEWPMHRQHVRRVIIWRVSIYTLISQYTAICVW